MFRIARETGYYTIALHESIRALIFAHNKHYDSNQSLFVNLFDIEHSEPREHFSRLLALDYFSRAASGGTSHGYKRRSQAEEYLHALGYTGSHIANTLSLLYERKCLEGRVLDVPFDEGGEDLRVTALGRYHISDLVKTFVYIDAVVVDTPILDSDVARRLTDVETLVQRLPRARDFLRYIDKCAGHLADRNARDLWNRIHDAILLDIISVEHEASE